ncbi:PREDICTED: deoxycytidylate deaminase-like, partial [Phaethon lepturus]|uniref:deoxycytidylate deaminase-like n=1 Tax=Phaethon lepturus TaxID=97097 RepID=UPI000530624B
MALKMILIHSKSKPKLLTCNVPYMNYSKPAIYLWFGNEASCKKREDYLEWPEYFMAVAFLSAQRSKDPSSQVGACIVNSENKIVGIGYNGMPNGCSDDVLPWTRTAAHRLDTKYPY